MKLGRFTLHFIKVDFSPMKPSIHLRALSVLAALSTLPLCAQNYKVTGSIPIGGNGRWDYLTVDSPDRRLFVSHGTEVDVVDLQSNKLVGKIDGLGGVHGIAIANHLGLGFISDGKNNQVVAFDLKSLAVKQKIAAGTNPDGIVYDVPTQRVFAFNGRSKNATAIDARNLRVVGTIALDGKPEFPVSSGDGFVYANIEDKSEIAKIDPKTLAVKEQWPLSPCESPSGLAMDTTNHRLFSVCDNKMMAIVNSENGKVLATPPIGEGPDAAAFDPGTHLAFSSNGESGTLTVIQEEGAGGGGTMFSPRQAANKFKVVETVQTAKSARTMALDPETHKIYLSSATFGSTPAATDSNPHPRPSVVPGSFKVLIVSK